MNESGVWAYLKRGMIGTGWHVTRVESSSGNGFPDVSYGIPAINGFIELKYIKEWAKRPSTKVKLPLRPEQKHWIKSRGELAGNVWVFIRIEDDFFLLTHSQAIIAAEEGSVKESWFDSYQHWYKKVDFEQICKLLERGC